MADAHANFAYTTVATAPSPATSGTSLVVAAGTGVRFPAVPFDATISPINSNPLQMATLSEIIRVTAISTDTLTIVRAQESSTARTVVVGDQIAATITAKTFSDVETDLANVLTQSALLAAQMAAREAASEGYCVNSGGALSVSGTAGKLDIAAGFDLFAGVQTAVSSATAISTTITSMADATNPKWVAVELSDGTTVNFNQGTAAASPAFPTPTASRVLHGWLYIPAQATLVDALLTTINGKAKLIDARVVQGSIYALLLGRSGGQTLTGDIASGGNLTLSSTAHATKGKILLGTSAYDEANNRLGIGTASPAYPVEIIQFPTANSGTFRGINASLLLDAASATTTSATETGILFAIATGNTATAFTGNLTGGQTLVTHSPSGSAINATNITGFVGGVILGAIGGSTTPTATSAFGGIFQAVNRSNQSGTVISTEMTGVESTVQQVGQGTIALSRGFAAIMTHLAGVATAGTTTLEIGYDLGFSFHTAGTITTAIGLRLQAWPAGPTYSNGPYGLSVEGTGSLNYIAGKTQIGGSSRPTSISPYLLVKGSILSDTAAGGIGYATGSGGAATQATSRTTGVTINAICGQITLIAAILNSGAITSFTLTNSSIAATDVVQVCLGTSPTASTYLIFVDQVAAGSCRIYVRNISAGNSPSEQPVINFVVIKGVTS